MTTTTGYQLKRLRKKMDLSLRELAERWGVGKSTLQREEKKKEVRGIYADAIRYLKATNHPGTVDDLDTTSPGYAVYREGDLQLLCNARSEEEALGYLRTMLDIPLSRDDLRFEKLTADEVAELAKEHRG